MTCTVMCLVVTHDNILGSDFWILSLRSYVIWLLQTITHSYHYHAMSITSFSYVENPCPCIHGMLLSSPCCILVSHLRSHAYGWKYYCSGTGCRYFFIRSSIIKFHCYFQKGGKKREGMRERKGEKEDNQNFILTNRKMDHHSMNSGGRIKNLWKKIKLVNIWSKGKGKLLKV